MKQSIEAWCIIDPEGEVWKTPKGKSIWSGKGQAKNAWNIHQQGRQFFDKDAKGFELKLLGTYEWCPSDD